MNDKLTKTCLVLIVVLLFGFLVNDIVKNRYEFFPTEHVLVRVDRYTGKAIIWQGTSGELYNIDFSSKKD